MTVSGPALRRGVILDRDGTLSDVVRDEESGLVSVAFHPSHVRLLPGVLEGLRALLVARGGEWAQQLAPDRPVRAAVNQAMAAGDMPISDGDEIAFFPPVTGG